jgi:hypothetical protein
MVYADGPTDKQLRHFPGLDAVEVRDEYSKLYKVEQRT